ncbi:MAG: hypothetical protein U9P14_05080, partial [Gemmatimonadota bacterium]|nr:hypothetical protein [Gemmatimonadota bacterium]
MKLLHWKTALTFAILAAPVVFTPLAAQQDTSAGVAVPDTTVSPGAPADSDSTLVPDSSAGATAGDSVAQAPDSTAPAAAADTVKKAKKKIRPPGEEIEAAVIGWDWDDYTIMTEAGLRRPDGREFSLAKNEFYDSCFSMAGKDVLVYGHPARDREGFYNFTLTAFPEEIAALAKDELEIKSKPPKPKLPRYINKNRVKG